MNQSALEIDKKKVKRKDPSPNIEIVDRDDPGYVDQITITKKQYGIGITKSIVFTSIAVLVFFIPMNINGKTDILFGYIYNYLQNLFGIVGLWIVTLLMVVNVVASFYGKFVAKNDSFLGKYYGHDSVMHPFFYLLGAFYTVIYTLDFTFTQFTGPDWIVGSGTGGTVIPSIVLGVTWIIIVGAFFMPFLLNYGGIDFVGSIMEPLMRPLFKVPGKSAIDAIASFVGSSSMAVIITSRLYRMNVYTRKEAAFIATSFSAVSVGFALLVINTAGLGDHFLKTYFSSLAITFLVSIVMIRIPPLSRKPNTFHSGKVQTVEDRTNEAKFELGIFKRGAERAAKRAYTAESLFKEIVLSLKDGFNVLPKVLTLIAAAGISGLIIAEYTPVFNWLGQAFIPLLNLFAVPNASVIAPSIPVGFAEMFLPVLLIADKIDVIEIGARYFITALSMVQIIFLSETVVVMMATKLPVKFGELVVCFLLRTLIAIPIVALFMHLLF
ncbi:YjiH family protein [Sporosarcina sp. JAI121]|uniref:YjiH family protein n=1 Tax=Sporosarcina sp. JAI121 TaxID=2723064 RepID=UPI0015CEA952|nr:YjiH family protein [Sporosarcina sp. JAI121]NYF23701.1 nucleoside recognition membrane protein YjiH [Sporosarcina sp. JAI121]